MSFRTIAFFLVLLLTAGTFAVAQNDRDRDDRDRDRNGVYADTNSPAFQMGVNEGARDRTENRQARLRDHHFRSDADRRAYEAGYQAGYNGNGAVGVYNGRSNGAYGYPQGGYGYPQGQYSADDRAFQIGMQQGINDGAHDAQTGHSFRAEKTEHYEDADSGYQRSFGDKKLYKQMYRQGYVRGYQQGFSQYANGQAYPNAPVYGQPYPNGQQYPNGTVYGQQYPGAPVSGQPGYPGGYGMNDPAYQRGFQDGSSDGFADRQTGHSFRATKTEHYEDANDGYDSSMGNKDRYKAAFRQGYLAGYQHGYNGNR